MWALLVVGLLAMFIEQLLAFWPILLFVVLVFAFQSWMGRPVSAAAEREAREALRHEQARREIDRIALETTRAMYAAAIAHADVIEGTAVELEPR
jgi:cobalamin biosynthesis protein CobD/CbiB